MKLFNFFSALFLIPMFALSQVPNSNNADKGHYDVMTFVSYDVNFGNNGIVIHTKIPDNAANNTTVYIKGFDNTGKTIGYQISWFFENGNFNNAAASSTGSSFVTTGTTNFFLGVDNSYLYISIDNFFTGLNMEITAFCDVSISTQNWFDDWSIDNGNIAGLEVPCVNRFGGINASDIYSDGNLNGANSTISNNMSVGGNITTGGLNCAGSAVFSNNVSIAKDFYLTTLSNSNTNKVLSTNSAGKLVLVDKAAYWTPNTANSAIINYNGVVSIGMANNADINAAGLSGSNYKLLIGGTVGARKIKVTQSTNWADYVFAKGYKLLPLSEIEKFIKRNGHLPEVPTAKEVNDNGVDIGETQVILLKKIEELTLHLIELNKKIEKQNKKIENFKKNHKQK